MAQITLNYNAKSANARKTIAYLMSLDYFKVINSDVSTYSDEFVAKINRGMKSKGKKVKVEDIWN